MIVVHTIAGFPVARGRKGSQGVCVCVCVCSTTTRAQAPTTANGSASSGARKSTQLREMKATMATKAFTAREDMTRAREDAGPRSRQENAQPTKKAEPEQGRRSLESTTTQRTFPTAMNKNASVKISATSVNVNKTQQEKLHALLSRPSTCQDQPRRAGPRERWVKKYEQELRQTSRSMTTTKKKPNDDERRSNNKLTPEWQQQLHLQQLMAARAQGKTTIFVDADNNNISEHSTTRPRSPATEHTATNETVSSTEPPQPAQPAAATSTTSANQRDLRQTLNDETTTELKTVLDETFPTAPSFTTFEHSTTREDLRRMSTSSSPYTSSAHTVMDAERPSLSTTTPQRTTTEPRAAHDESSTTRPRSPAAKHAATNETVSSTEPPQPAQPAAATSTTSANQRDLRQTLNGETTTELQTVLDETFQTAPSFTTFDHSTTRDDLRRMSTSSSLRSRTTKALSSTTTTTSRRDWETQKGETIIERSGSGRTISVMEVNMTLVLKS